MRTDITAVGDADTPLPAPVVTLAGLYGAAGSVVGPRVADRLGVPFLDRGILLGVAEELRLSEAAAEQLDSQSPQRDRGAWRRYFDSLGRAAGADAAPMSDIERVEAGYRSQTEQFLARATVRGGVVLGRGGTAGRAVVQGGRCAPGPGPVRRGRRRPARVPALPAGVVAPLTPPDVLPWLADPARVAGLAAGDADLLAASYRDRPDWSVDDVPLLDELAGLLGPPPAAPKAPEPEWRLRELSTGPRRVDDFVLSCGLRDGWELYAPGHPTPIAAAGPAIDNDAVAAAQRWAEAVILREGHRVVGWKDGFDPHGEDAYTAVLAEPLPVREPDDEPSTQEPYLHVILDEAQDLSPMECRMIARRAEYASMTVVGDLGQATHPLAAGSWPGLLARLGKRDVRTLELHTGYRVPQVIADYAARALAPGIAPTRSYRPGGSLSVRWAGDLYAAVREAVRQAPRDASVAVVAADGTAPLIDATDVTVVPASLVKGLEYDHVIVVEPADIVAAEPRGLNRLYVALTRAVSDLVVLHHKPLPAALRDIDPAG